MIFSQTFCNTTKRGDVSPLFVQETKNIPCVRAAFSDDDFLKNPEIMQWASRYNRYVILGIGGSSLCGQAIKCACMKKNSAKQIDFIDNIYPQSFCVFLSSLDTANTGILVISKSGETIETLAQLSLVFNKYPRQYIAEHFLIITENKPSSLIQFQRNFGALFVEHPSDIGGRFSVFSPVGTLPAYIMGCDIDKLKSGATQAFEKETYVRGAEFMTSAYNCSQRNGVFMTYSDKLYKFKEWIAQLYAESSGKQGQGLTPLLSVGTTDQHSQLQLYLGGPKDKCFSIFVEHAQEDVLFGVPLPFSHSVLKGRSLDQLFVAEAYATVESIQKHGLPVRVFDFQQITEYELGALFMHFILEVILFCKMIDVDPFGQPDVEFGKKLAIEKLCSN